MTVFALVGEQRIGNDQQRLHPVACQSMEPAVDLLIVGGGKHAKRQPQRRGGIANLGGIACAGRMYQYRDCRGVGRELAQQL